MELKAALETLWVMLLLRKAGKVRIAIMIDSPYHMYSQTRFSITEARVQDVEEYKNAAPE